MKLSKLKTWFGRQTKLIATVMVAAIVGGATTAAVLAAVPDANGVIHSCYKTGLLSSFKIIDSPSQSCAAGQTELTWNKTNGAHVVNGSSDFVSIDSAGIVVDGHTTPFTASCPTGEYALGGYVTSTGNIDNLFGVNFSPRGTPTDLLTMEDDDLPNLQVGDSTGFVGPYSGTATFHVICMPVASLPQ